MNLPRTIQNAYQVGVKLAFSKFAAPEDDEIEEAEPFEEIEEAEPFEAPRGSGPAPATNTLLSNPVTPDTLRQHGYNDTDLDSFVSPIEAEMQQIESQYFGQERQRRLEDLAERVYGNFAALPDSELEALSQGRENIEHDLATGSNRHTNTALQSSPLTRPMPDSPRVPFFNEPDWSKPGPIAHVPILHNPAHGQDHSFTPNAITTGKYPYPGIYENQHSLNYTGLPLYDSFIFPASLRNGPSVGPLDMSQNGDATLPFFVNKAQREYDERVSEGYTPHPGGMRGDTIQLGATRVPEHHTTGKPVTDELVEDPFTYAHEMYHHKVNNIGRSHPTLGRLHKYLRPGDNEMYADYYASQAPRSAGTDALFHDRILHGNGQYRLEENPEYHNPKHPLQITPPGSPPMHFKPSVRMNIPRVGPLTGSR